MCDFSVALPYATVTFAAVFCASDRSWLINSTQLSKEYFAMF